MAALRTDSKAIRAMLWMSLDDPEMETRAQAVLDNRCVIASVFQLKILLALLVCKAGVAIFDAVLSKDPPVSLKNLAILMSAFAVFFAVGVWIAAWQLRRYQRLTINTAQLYQAHRQTFP